VKNAPRKPMVSAIIAILVLISPIYAESASNLEKYLDCSSEKKIDIVFVFDTTNSMGGEISELRATANKFATDLEASNIDYQLGLVEFRDFPETCDGFSCGSPGDYAYSVMGNGTLTSEIGTFGSWLKELKAGGGGSPGPEAVLAALRHAGSDLSWRSDAEKAIIVLTDAGAHPDGSCCNAEGDTLEGTIFELVDIGARAYIIGPEDASLKNIAENTGGQFYEIRSGLSLKPLLEEITKSLGCSFRTDVATACENNQLEVSVQLIGKETIPYISGQTEAWMYLDQAGSISRFNLSYDQEAEAYLGSVPDVCGPVDLTVYGHAGDRSAVQTVQVECDACGVAAEAEEQGALSISGRIYDDSNGDGVKGEDEAGLDGWEVSLLKPDGGSVAQESDRKGYYIFTGILPGSYRVVANAQENWTATSPETGTMDVELIDVHESEIDFGFKLHLFLEPNQSRSEIIVFPDPNLDAAVRAAINKPDGAIYSMDLDGLKELDASSKDIKNITGLEYCDTLGDLNLGSNQITDMSPLSGLTSIVYLSLYGNQITDISPLSGLINLRIITLEKNQITDVSPLSGLTNLVDLSLDSNQIADLSPLSRLTNLEGLDLHDNQIADLSPLSGLTNLTRLTLGNNQVADLSPLSRLTNLEGLDLEGNQIADLSPLSGLTNLTLLSLDSNQVADLSPLSGLTNLEDLFLDNNQIADLSPLSGLKHLKWLFINGKNNQIADLSSLSGLTNLANLQLDSNRIADLSPLSGLTNLTLLSLDSNQVADLSPLSGLTNLNTLFLRGNEQITDVSPLSRLTNLSKLYIDRTHITDVSPLDGLTKLLVYD